MLVKHIPFLLVFFMQSSYAFSPISYKHLEDVDIDSAFSQGFIVGVGSGVEWQHQVVKENGGAKYFCVPDDVALTGEDYISILRSYFITNPAMKNEPLGVSMAFAMIDKFPCK